MSAVLGKKSKLIVVTCNFSRINKEETTKKEEKKKHEILVQWLSATLDLLLHAYLLALSHSGRHERTVNTTAVRTLLFCAGPIEGCSAVLAVPTVDTAAVAFGAWFVLCPAEEKQAQKQKLRLVVFQS